MLFDVDESTQRLETSFDRIEAALDRPTMGQWMIFLMVWSTAWITFMAYLSWGCL
jgi:hypothetical protein